MPDGRPGDPKPREGRELDQAGPRCVSPALLTAPGPSVRDPRLLPSRPSLLRVLRWSPLRLLARTGRVSPWTAPPRPNRVSCGAPWCPVNWGTAQDVDARMVRSTEGCSCRVGGLQVPALSGTGSRPLPLHQSNRVPAVLGTGFHPLPSGRELDRAGSLVRWTPGGSSPPPVVR